MSKIEMKYTIIFFNARTLAGARAGMRTLEILERQAATIEESDTIKYLMDFLFVRSNIALAEGRA